MREDAPLAVLPGAPVTPVKTRATNMPVEMRHEHGNIYGLEIRGTLRKADFERCEQMLAAEIERIGPVRLLVVLEGSRDGSPRQTGATSRFT
jgi:hypothetical protein